MDVEETGRTAVVEVTEEDAEGRNKIRDGKSAVATPDWRSRKKLH